MPYEDRAALMTDEGFMGRLNACVANEAVGRTDTFSNRILGAWGYGGQVFGPLVISAPGFDRPPDQITDGDLLAAVQANWARAELIAAGP